MSYNQNIDRMFIEYKVYRRVSDLKPFISRVELPSCQMIGAGIASGAAGCSGGLFSACGVRRG